MAAVRWQRSTREVAFVVCPKCCQRFDCELDAEGNATAYLYRQIVHHPCFAWPRLHAISWREFKPWVHVEIIDLDTPTDVSDIISATQLRLRAESLCRRYPQLSRTQAQERVKRQVRWLVNSIGKSYVCKKCGRRITPRRAAAKSGIGVSHRGDS